MKDNTKNRFPLFRLVIGSILGGLLAHISSLTAINDTAIYKVPLLQALIFSFIFGLIPMYIAYNRDIVKKEIVYWLAFLSMVLPFGIIIFLIALFLSIICKNNKDLINNENNMEAQNNKVTTNKAGSENIVNDSKCIDSKDDVVNFFKSKLYFRLHKTKIMDLLYKIFCPKIILAVSVISVIGIFCYIYVAYEEENFKLKIYNLCMDKTDKFFEEMDDYTVMELSKTDAITNARKTLNLSCECENKAIVSSILNPFTRLKYMRSISLSYGHWEKYYENNDRIFYKNYKRNIRTCMDRDKKTRFSLSSRNSATE